MTSAFGALTTAPTPTPPPALCLLLVTQQIIHVLSGRLHLANAALLLLPAAAYRLSAAV